VFRARASLVLAVALALAGCASPPPPPGQVLASESLAFLVDGKTTREDVTLRLGLPSRTFESDRIVLYRIGWNAERGAHALDYAPVAAPAYDLVLVFDSAGVVARHALVAK
jgi:outer membrane protein assembly factor BamE (lipoprotein component of BamABCDE complex)